MLLTLVYFGLRPTRKAFAGLEVTLDLIRDTHYVQLYPLYHGYTQSMFRTLRDLTTVGGLITVQRTDGLYFIL